jgi:hypothetical protein
MNMQFTSTVLWGRRPFEKQSSSAALARAACGICLTILLAAYTVCADSWFPPTPFVAVSENGQFVAHVTPASTNSKATVVVSAIKGQRTNELWRATLSNHSCPTEVFVSDDGSGVVSLDNWGGVGYGDDVVALYGPGGQKAKYSLEEFAPPPKPKPDSSGFPLTPIHGGYEGKFTHSTSSRHWRRYSIEFFFRVGSDVVFCIWLDWDKRWVVWQVVDGKLRKVTADLTKTLNAEARRRALQQARSGTDSSAPLNFLARLGHSEDRPLIEAWLRDKDFSTGSKTSYSSDKSKPSFFCWMAYSHKRKEAEKILSCWDGLTTNTSDMENVENYHYLGTVKVRVLLEAPPKKGGGMLRLYLIPAAVPLDKWSASQPEHYLIADLDNNFPVVFQDGKITDFPLTRTVDAAFYGVTAGDYRLKAVWNKAPPIANAKTIVCLPRSGDFESISSPVISVKRGQVSDGRVECIAPAGK